MIGKMFTAALAALLMASAPAVAQEASPHIRVLLVGDSTMQRNSGYGQVLCDMFSDDVYCSNRAVGGRSSKSYRVDGFWDRAMMTLAEDEGFDESYVLIQLGHNDGSSLPQRHTELPEYEANMRAYVDEAREAGATVVLITPVTDRRFRDWELQDGLRPWADIVTRIAEDKDVILIDLFELSREVVEAMGPSQAALLAPAPPPPEIRAAAREGRTVQPEPQEARPNWDHVHLGPRGAELHSAQVADALRRQLPELGAYLTDGD